MPNQVRHDDHLQSRIGQTNTKVVPCGKSKINMSSVDTMATLEALIQVLPGEIAEGKIVKLGEFGSFGITLQSEGAETEEAFTASNIKRFSIRFRPGKIFKNTLSNAGYKKE